MPACRDGIAATLLPIPNITIVCRCRSISDQPRLVIRCTSAR